MNLRDLKYLIAIADHAHFGMAADACFVSQPALSMQIKKLENVLGVQLIERTSKSALLTEIGKLVTKEAREIIARVENLKALTKEASDPLSGELRLGIIPTLAPYLLPHIIPGLTTLFPHLTLYLIEAQTDSLMLQLEQAKIDCGLLALPIQDDHFVSLPLFEEEFLLAVPTNHLFANRKRVKLEELKDKILMLLEDGHCLRDHALEVCSHAHAVEAKGFRATSLETLIHMVSSNAGITLVPKLACKANQGISHIPFVSPPPARIIGMVWRPSTSKHILLRLMIDEIRKLMFKQKSVKVFKTPIQCR